MRRVMEALTGLCGAVALAVVVANAVPDEPSKWLAAICGGAFIGFVSEGSWTR